MAVNDLSGTVGKCIDALSRYDLAALQHKYDPRKWSIGQLLMHVVESTSFFLDNVETCWRHQHHVDEPTSQTASLIFAADQMPDIDIVGPPSNDLTPQPQSIQEIRESLLLLKERAGEIGLQLMKNPPSGKEKHPGLGYFDAGQWYHFADIHIRHHLRQLARLEKGESGIDT
jgi:hypothetical protein